MVVRSRLQKVYRLLLRNLFLYTYLLNTYIAYSADFRVQAN